MSLNRYFLFVSYEGISFNGSQIQGQQPTIQLALNQALSTLLRMEIATYGASRTDEGVHARENVYHFDADDIDKETLMYKLNAILPHDISVNSILSPIKNLEANCRFDAIKRHYRYALHHSKNPFLYHRSLYYPYTLDYGLLNLTADEILRHKDFTTFSKRNTQSHTMICNIYDSRWEVNASGIEFVVSANRFLRGMVRALVGTQLQVGRKRYDIEEFQRRIIARDCTLADFSVPGYGLYLEKIEYPEGYFLP